MINEINCFKYKNELFENKTELDKFLEQELIYTLEDIAILDEYGISRASEFIGILLEYNITSRKKLISLREKML